MQEAYGFDEFSERTRLRVDMSRISCGGRRVLGPCLSKLASLRQRHTKVVDSPVLASISCLPGNTAQLFTISRLSASVNSEIPAASS